MGRRLAAALPVRPILPESLRSCSSSICFSCANAFSTTLTFSCASFAVRCSCSIFSMHSQNLLLDFGFLLVGHLNLEEMGLIFLVGLQLGQSRPHLVRVRVMRLKILFVRPTLFDQRLHGRRWCLEGAASLLEGGFDRLEPLGNFSALVR